ncbi:hypothetical protein GCM10027425_33610 [Alteromonas gracilis]
MGSTRRQQSGTAGEAWAVWIGIAAAAAALLFTWVPLHVAALVDDRARPSGNPFTLLFELIGGEVRWSTTATIVAAGMALLVLVVGGVAARWWLRRRGSRARVDTAARHMGSTAASGQRARQTAQRLGIEGEPGILIGHGLRGGRPLLQDWEAVSVDVWGPRSGKTTARAIPAVLTAPGAVLATSNKRDLVDATRDVRSARGDEVWVFDPQGLVDEPVTWWWNPLSYVTDETRARQLAQVFASSGRRPDARTDAYFDNAALDLLAGLLLAAAEAGRELHHVYLWLADPNDAEPARLLSEHGHELAAASVMGVVTAPDKQRAGVYGTAQQVCSFMTNPSAMRWVLPGPGREFVPEDFVTGSGTLYSLSREGRGNTAPLVTALTMAVCEAAEEHASTQPGGRLRIPMVAVLDEAANVCRWTELPNLYSHYGSRGITLMTFLQSWSQGVEVWGREGMRKLWSAATVKVYGGGVSEVEFLEELSRLVGDYSRPETSITRQSRGDRGRSYSTQQRSDRILDVAELAALDRGRAVVINAGEVPTLARTVPWWETPHADAVRASLSAHDPATARARATIATSGGEVS